MKTVLFVIPLKSGCLQHYKEFAKQTVERKVEYKDMLLRYDIHSVKIWCKNFNSHDYVMVYHEVGAKFTKLMKNWDQSSYPFDTWFRENMVACYDIKSADEMETPEAIVEFKV